MVDAGNTQGEQHVLLKRVWEEMDAHFIFVDLIFHSNLLKLPFTTKIYEISHLPKQTFCVYY